MNEKNNALGKLLKSARLEKGLTQEALATLCDVSQTTIGVWETGKNKPSVENLTAIATALDLSISLLSSHILETVSAELGIENPDADREALLRALCARLNSLPTQKLIALAIMLDVSH